MLLVRLRLFHRSLVAKGYLPLGRLARFTLYLLGLDLLLYICDVTTRAVKHVEETSITGWVNFLAFIASILLFILLVRWVRRHVLWRLRNRLIVTYVFIGVIPVMLLACIVVILSYLFIGQFATYVATSDLRTELKGLEAVNSRLASEVATALRNKHPLTTDLLETSQTSEEMYPHNQVTAWFKGKAVVLPASALEKNAAPALPVPLPKDSSSESGVMALDGSALDLRAVRELKVGTDSLIVISSAPVDRDLMSKIAKQIGVMTLTPFLPARRSQARSPGATMTITSPDQRLEINPGNDPAYRISSGGELPPAANSYDREIKFAATVNAVDWNSGAQRSMFLVLTTRPSLLYHRLFLSVGEFVNAVMIALAAIAIFFALIELVALIVGIRLTRTVTRSIAELYKATQRVNRGDLSHQIKVLSSDQLAELEKSFNSMTGSLQRLLIEQKEKQRLENELSIAQEVQATLFPKKISQLGTLELYGLCRPARTVSGDYYDFVPLGANRMAIAVGDISGKGISAALLMATIHSAVRAYSLERTPAFVAAIAGGGTVAADASAIDISPAQLCAMLNRQVYASTPPEKYATLFLAVYDGATRRLSYSNAGHLCPLVLHTNGSLTRLDCGGSVIGLLDALKYEEAEVQLAPGDLVLAYSDGVTEPENEFGEFGEDRLIDLVRDNFNQDLPRISEQVITTIMDWIGEHEQPDDVTLVLARVR